MLSFPHLVVLFVIALIIFGPQKLPELARMLGKATAEFRKMTNDFRFALEDEVRELDRQNRIREEQAAAARIAEAAKSTAPAPSPESAALPEGSVPRAIPETTVTATVEPPAEQSAAEEPAQNASPASNEYAGLAPSETEPVSVPHEKPADDHVA